MGSLRQSAHVGSRTGVRKRPPTTPLLQAIDHQQKGRLTELLQCSEPLTKDELDDALIKAAARGDMEACRLLLTAGADPNTQEDPEKVNDHYSCCPAFSTTHAKYQLWLESSTALAGTALHVAVEGGHTDVVQLLLENGSDPCGMDLRGMTPLMLAAARRGSAHLTELLLDAEACDVDLVDSRHGRTALHYAATAGDSQTFRVLLLAGADIDSKDKEDNTPLMLAVTAPVYEDPSWSPRDTEGCLRLLLQRGCFINVVNCRSETALHAAIESCDAAAVKILLEYDAVVQPEMVHQVCLLHLDSKVLQAVVKFGRRVKPHLYLCVLIIVIRQHASQWRIDNKGEADRSHIIARELIKGIPTLAIVEELFHKGMSELRNLFQEGEEEEIRDILDDLETLGLVGVALKHGKYGIARMLHQAGSEVKPLDGNQDFQHWALRPWLPSALSNPRSLKMLCRPLVRNHWGCDILGKVSNLPDEIQHVETFLSMSDLDGIHPYDKTVLDQEENLLDECYQQRETAKAAYQQTVWLYSNH